MQDSSQAYLEESVTKFVTTAMSAASIWYKGRPVILKEIQSAFELVAKVNGYGSLDLHEFNLIAMKKNRHTHCKELGELIHALRLVAPRGIIARWTLASGWESWEEPK